MYMYTCINFIIIVHNDVHIHVMYMLQMLQCTMVFRLEREAIALAEEETAETITPIPINTVSVN